MMRARHVLTAILTVVAVGAAGCGEAVSPEERVAAAADATATAQTAAFTMELVMAVGGNGAAMDMTMTGEGAMDFDARLGHMTMELPGMGLAADTIFDGDVTYTQMPAMFGADDDQWMRQQAEDADLGMGLESGLGDGPADMMAALEAVDGEVESLGSDEVRDEPVEGFAFTVRGADLAGDAAVADTFADLEVPVEAWIDAEDRLRRLISEVDMAAAMDAAMTEADRAGDDAVGAELDAMIGDVAGTMTMTLELFDFGVDVDVSVPDDADVVDVDDPQLLEGMPGMDGMEKLPGAEHLPEGMDDLDELDGIEEFEELEEQLEHLRD